jgi:hypothetical protein
LFRHVAPWQQDLQPVRMPDLWTQMAASDNCWQLQLVVASYNMFVFLACLSLDQARAPCACHL